MAKIPFSEKEMEVVGTYKNRLGIDMPILNYPCTLAEADKANRLDRDPLFMQMGVESALLCPDIIPDDRARGFVLLDKPVALEDFGGKDMFGIEWVFVPQVGGSMVKPGNPTLEDASEWKKVIKMPDIDAWDWEGSHAQCKPYLDANEGKSVTLWFLNGMWFERLISFMDFEGAAMALLDEDQIDGVKEIAHEITDLYLHMMDKFAEHFPEIKGISVHDDWGSQGAPFFSEQIAREVYLPEMKRFTEAVHAHGWMCDLHSCGHVEERCGVFVDAGFDSWTPMPMNDTVALWEKYGDKMTIGVVNPFHFDPETASEEEQRECARKFAEKFCKPGTTVQWSTYNNAAEMTPAFFTELYKQSRIAYCGC